MQIQFCGASQLMYLYFRMQTHTNNSDITPDVLLLHHLKRLPFSACFLESMHSNVFSNSFPLFYCYIFINTLPSWYIDCGCEGNPNHYPNPIYSKCTRDYLVKTKSKGKPDRVCMNAERNYTLKYTFCILQRFMSRHRLYYEFLDKCK